MDSGKHANMRRWLASHRTADKHGYRDVDHPGVCGASARVVDAGLVRKPNPYLNRRPRMLKIGMMQDFRNPREWRRPNHELYGAILDQVVRAEELGYDNAWLTEHHFADDGYNPSLLPTAAAIATRTHRIRIGTFVLLLPFQHPVRVAAGADRK